MVDRCGNSFLERNSIRSLCIKISKSDWLGFLLFCFETRSYSSSDCPRTHCVDQSDLKLAQIMPDTQLKFCTTILPENTTSF